MLQPLQVPEWKWEEVTMNFIMGLLRLSLDMPRAFVLQYGRIWNKNLPYAEFSYNNSYQQNLKMAPFEMLYGCRCQTPLIWNDTGERKVFGPDILQEAEKQVHVVRENLQIVP
jgi:hypothetical protein